MESGVDRGAPAARFVKKFSVRRGEAVLLVTEHGEPISKGVPYATLHAACRPLQADKNNNPLKRK